MTDLTMSLAVKLGSLVVHAQELDPGNANSIRFDVPALQSLAGDPEVLDWLAQFSPGLLPEKRR